MESAAICSGNASIAFLIVTAITLVENSRNSRPLLSMRSSSSSSRTAGSKHEREIDHGLAIVGARTRCDVHHRPDVFEVSTEELEVALDVRSQHSCGAVLREDPRKHRGAGLLKHRTDDLPDEFLLAREVIRDDTLADARAPRDLGQGSVGVSKFRDGIDCAFDNLGAPRNFDE